MKELVVFEVPCGQDRSDLTAILAAAGYPCVQRVTDDPAWSWEKHYEVVVFKKPVMLTEPVADTRKEEGP